MTDVDSVFIYRASELGGCEKALIAKRIGYEPDLSVYSKGNDRMKTIFAEGDLHEEAIVAKYKDKGDKITLQQHECNLPIMPGVIVQGHLDGVIMRDSLRSLSMGAQGRVLEIKSMGDSTFKEFKKKGMDTPGLVQKYKWQISAYMIAMERPAILICKNRNTGEIIETLIDDPFYSYQDIRTKIFRIEAAARTGALPVACNPVQFPCPFHYLHEEGEDTAFVVDTAIDAFVKVYTDAKEEEDRAKQKAKQARERIMALSNGKKVETPNSRVNFYTQKRKKVDWDRVVEDYSVHVESYTVETESDPIMRITDKKKDKGEDDGTTGNDGSGTQTSLFG